MTQEKNPEIVEAVRVVLNAFNEGLFVRSTKGDGDPAWALKFIEPLKALGVLQEWFDSGAASAEAE